MNLKRLTSLFALAAIMALPVGAKKTLDHDSFDDWKLVRNHSLSNNGEWASFSVNPQEGDGVLTFCNTAKGRKIEIPRGYSPSFSADARWALALVKPLFADTRKAKIDKKKKFDLPQDSLAIIDLKSGKVTRIPRVIGYRIGKEGGDWVAYQSCDTNLISEKDLKDDDAGKPLVVRHLSSGVSKTVKWVKDYIFSRDGRRLALTTAPLERDSTASRMLACINIPDTSLVVIDRDRKHFGAPVFDWSGERLAFTASDDSVKSGTRRTSLYLSGIGSGDCEPREIKVEQRTPRGANLQMPHSSDPVLQEKLKKEWEEAQRRNAPKELLLNQYSTPVFSRDGKRLVVGVAPVIAPDDTTLVDFEKPSLDIWRWDAPYTPPQENGMVEELRKKTYPVCIDLADDDSQVLVTSNPLVDVIAPAWWNGDWALLRDQSQTVVSQQWNYYAPEDLSVVNLNTGATKYIGKVFREFSGLSACDRYVVWFQDRDYYAYDIQSGESRMISGGIPYPLWDEKDDHPMPPTPLGIAGWSENDGALLVYDRFDIWSLDPSGKRAPVCITGGEGRTRNLRFRYVETDPERKFLKKGDEMLLSVFDFTTKEKGLATLSFDRQKKPVLRVLDKYSFSQVRRAKENPTYSFVKANFSVSPDIWIARNSDFAKARKVTDANPQQADYNWGTARLEKWYAYDGSPAEGVLYVPEDFDETKKYPMLCVFYETGSEDLYTHYVMEPSWSWVNYPFYVSRGYVVFVPDIHYTSGIPGECAYNYVCSGAEEMCRRYPWIDKDRIGIDGQSWGGYQTAYLVTRTDMFACAGSGAPVANMTSAFGGIRWESGDSRQAQYEMGQSRIGRNLWEAPELYIANSPVFHADRVHTPLLIMHNDQDGAVPWYQGIEMFMALRRLNKPVWMLQYNGEAHNLKERRNRKDITKRLQQFFDHYLKGDPMPRWMREGIPSVRKGQEFGY